MGKTEDQVRSIAEKALGFTKVAKCEQTVTRLLSEIAAGEASAEAEGWIDEANMLAEFKG